MTKSPAPVLSQEKGEKKSQKGGRGGGGRQERMLEGEGGGASSAPPRRGKTGYDEEERRERRATGPLAVFQHLGPTEKPVSGWKGGGRGDAGEVDINGKSPAVIRRGKDICRASQGEGENLSAARPMENFLGEENRERRKVRKGIRGGFFVPIEVLLHTLRSKKGGGNRRREQVSQR